jgi:hypothetical protein
MAAKSEDKLQEVQRAAASESFRKVYSNNLTDAELRLISELATRDTKSLLKESIGYCILMSSKEDLDHKERVSYLSLAVQGMKTIVAAEAKRQENSMKKWFGEEHQAGPETVGHNPMLPTSLQLN